MIIHGAFVAGRPAINCPILLPIVSRLSTRRLRLAVQFVVDTGATNSIVLPVTYEARGFRYSDFREYPQNWARGYGGEFEVRVVPVTLHLKRSDNGDWHKFDLDMELAKPDIELDGLPSVIGQDVLDRFELTVNKAQGIVSFTDP